MIEITPLGKFVVKHSVLVPIKFWIRIFRLAEHYLSDGSDWPLFLDEIASGCQELRDGRLQEIICITEEAI